MVQLGKLTNFDGEGGMPYLVAALKRCTIGRLCILFINIYSQGMLILASELMAK